MNQTQVHVYILMQSYGQVDAVTPLSVLETDHLGDAQECDNHFLFIISFNVLKNPI